MFIPKVHIVAEVGITKFMDSVQEATGKLRSENREIMDVKFTSYTVEAAKSANNNSFTYHFAIIIYLEEVVEDTQPQ